MHIVDGHCHVSLIWYEPVETLLFQMDRNGVGAAILVQMQGQTNNDYLLECVRRFPGRFAPVVCVDTGSYNADAIIEDLVRRGASGIRLKASARSPGQDPLAIWRAADRLRLSISCAGTSSELASNDFERLVQVFPNAPIVLEHLASSGHPDSSEMETEARLQAFTLARYDNVLMKFGGLGEYCPRSREIGDPFPFAPPHTRWMESAYDAFGPSRLMWGSNFPPSSQREGYRNSLHFAMAQFSNKSIDELALMFGSTARSVFPIRG